MSVESLASSLLSPAPSLAKLAGRFPLGWSHYLPSQQQLATQVASIRRELEGREGGRDG